MKCKTLAQELRLIPMRVGRLRKKLFPDVENGSDITSEQAEAIRNAVDELTSAEVRKELEEAVKPKIVTGYITFARIGQREVECHIQDGPKGNRVRALMPSAFKSEKNLRKPILLEEIFYEDKAYYRHASLAGRAWGLIYEA